MKKHHKVKIDDDALDAAVKLSSRYITKRFLPDKAIDLMDEAAARLRIMNAEKSNKLSKAKAKLKKVSDSYDEEILHENFDDAAKLRKEVLKLKRKVENLTAKTN